ncbi:hypothetical protein [Carnobacterium maltaromaticum]|uniref:hypothetical protein n=1 Tax=Carnobacterium maltaromaticum TaxID=2751 RepID=UPI00295F5354|nr:hypothetical protein [Carnobacterium maltaromaticum]
MNQIIISFYTIRTVLMQEVIISHTSKLIVILAAISTLMNLIFNYFMPVEYDEGNVQQNLPLKNMIVSLGVSTWSLYFLRPNVLYKLTNEWVGDTTIYAWYIVRSVELVIATVVVIQLVSYLVKQINVIVREKELVVLELLNWSKSSFNIWKLKKYNGGTQ